MLIHFGHKKPALVPLDLFVLWTNLYIQLTSCLAPTTLSLSQGRSPRSVLAQTPQARSSACRGLLRGLPTALGLWAPVCVTLLLGRLLTPLFPDAAQRDCPLLRSQALGGCCHLRLPLSTSLLPKAHTTGPGPQSCVTQPCVVALGLHQLGREGKGSRTATSLPFVFCFLWV